MSVSEMQEKERKSRRGPGVKLAHEALVYNFSCSFSTSPSQESIANRAVFQAFS